MKNQRIFRDIADRSGAAFGASGRTTSVPAIVKLRAAPLSKKSRSPVNGAPVARTSGGVAELKVQIDGLPLIFVFPFEDLSPIGRAGFDVSRTDISSLLSNTLEKIVNRLRGSGVQQVAALPSNLAPTVIGMNPNVEAAPASGAQTMLSVGPLELNLLDRTATRGGRPIDLRPREFQLLRYMMERRDKLLTRAKLLQEVWNYKFLPETNLVDVHMGRLRRKVDGPNEPAMISSVRGSGFVLSTNPLSQN